MFDSGTNEGRWIQLNSRWLAFKDPLTDLAHLDDLQWSDQMGSAEVSCGTVMFSLWTLFNDLFEGPPLNAIHG